MTWIFVMVMLVGGHLQYQEIGSFKSSQACEAEFQRLIEKYQHDGIALADINGGCYMVKTPWP